MNQSYNKWDKWASELDDEGNNKKEIEESLKNMRYEFGKPMTEEEFKNRNDKDENVETIKINTN